MKFRMFTDAKSGLKVAVNVDHVTGVEECVNHVVIYIGDDCVKVSEDFHTVISRLNTIAE